MRSFIPWLSRARSSPGARARLICLPHAGGSARFYTQWGEALSPGVEVWAVELPGHGYRLGEPCFTRLDALLDALVPALAPVLDQPFALFGHSMGALVAYELARRLERERTALPLHLFVSGKLPPQWAMARSWHQLPAQDLVAAIQRCGGTPPELFRVPELIDAFLPSVRADLEMVETHPYRPSPQVDCPLTALGGIADDIAPAEWLSGWGLHTRREFRLELFSGGHFFLRDSQAAVTGCLARTIDAALERPSPSAAAAAAAP